MARTCAALRVPDRFVRLRQVILHGGSLIVSPTVRPEVIATANRYGVPVYSGAFTASECQSALEAGATMVKIFPAQIGGPKYMTNLKMVFPEIQLCPSGGNQSGQRGRIHSLRSHGGFWSADIHGFQHDREGRARLDHAAGGEVHRTGSPSETGSP